MRSIWTLAHRELVRFYRQKPRVIALVASPLILWLLLGKGMGNSFSMPGATQYGYSEFFFAGVLVMTALFSSIFSMISLIEDRNEGFLQGVLVAPVLRISIVLGKILGGALISLIQVGLLCMIAPWAGIHWTLHSALMVFVVIALMSFQMGALGFVLAWRTKTVASFHSVMNAVLLPMWMLSGSLFPTTEGPRWLQWLCKLNPLTYVTELLRIAFNQYGHLAFSPHFSWLVSIAVLVVFLALSLWTMKSRKVFHVA